MIKSQKTVQQFDPGDRSGPFILKDFLPYKLAVASARLSGIIAAHYSEKFDMTLPEWRCMAVIGSSKTCSASTIVQTTVMDKVAVHRAISRLLKQNRLQQSADPQDKRRNLLSLTDTGKKIYGEIILIALETETKLLDQIGDKQGAMINNLIDHINKAIDAINCPENPKNRQAY